MLLMLMPLRYHIQKNKYFESVQKACTDPMFLVKANIFLSVAQECQPFLTKYQTDKPMLPFLADNLFTTLMHLLQRFVRDDVLKRMKTTVKLFSEDFKDQSNHKDASLINIGFVADKQLSKLRVRKKVSEQDVLTVIKETKEFLVTAVTKLLEKCPLKYTLVINLVWLDPQKIKEKPGLCEKQLKLSLQIISSAGKVRENKCDTILNQFRDFAVICKTSEDASEWPTGAHSRLDTFFHAQLAKEHAFKDLWEIVQKVLLLSHGQASVERGFSVNKNITVANMKERTLIAQRVIVDRLHHVGGVTNVVMTKELLKSAGCARQRYHEYLDEEKKKEHTQQTKKQQVLQDEVDQMKMKRRKLQNNMNALLTSADELAIEAEANDNTSVLAKSNALRRAAKDKEQELMKYDKNIEKKINEMKKR